MRFAGTFIAILASFIASTAGLADTLHVISIADSNDPRIGIGADANSKGIQSYATLVSSATNLQFDFKEISGSKFNCGAITNAVEELHVNPNDIVLFYYSGHGLSPKKDLADASGSAFPSFFCSGDDLSPPDAGTLPNLQTLAQKIKSKGARFTLAIADTCNVILPVPEVSAARGLTPPPSEKIRTMFLKFSGLIVISSSKTGEFSWYRQEGGLFSRRFLQILSTPPASKPEKLWDSVIGDAIQEITVSSDGVPILQHPQSFVDGLTYHP